MTGIPVYTSSPINAAKAQGVTSQTAEPVPYTPAPPTTTASTLSSYPPAQPGAAAMPAPTSTASQRFTPLQPTPTTKSGLEGPPAPQPGAVPTLPKSYIPPPPKVGENYQPPPQPYPAQMAIPPPTMPVGAPPTSTTSTSTAPSFAHPVALPSGQESRQSIEHPPGYKQDTYASEMTSDQRRAQETNNSSSLGGGTADENEGIFAMAKQWVQTAGTKIAQSEAEVWRKINKE